MRQVYFDPFGQRTEGYRAGIADESSLQDNTRRARTSDYQYNVLNPIDLHNLQRESAFQDFYGPYRQNLAKYQDQLGQSGVYNENVKNALGFAQYTGIPTPLNNVLFDQFHPQVSNAQIDPETGTMMGQPTAGYRNYFGGVENYNVTPQAPLQYDDFGRMMQRTQLEMQMQQFRQQQMYQQQLENDRQRRLQAYMGQHPDLDYNGVQDTLQPYGIPGMVSPTGGYPGAAQAPDIIGGFFQ